MDADDSLNDSMSLRRSARHSGQHLTPEDNSGAVTPSTSASVGVKREHSDESDTEIKPRKRGRPPNKQKTTLLGLKKYRKRHRMRLRRVSGGGSSDLSIKQERVRFSEPVRRSTREKRLVFATFNLQEMNKQMLNPAHDFPGIDSSDDDMDPYEKLLSPNRVTRRSRRLQYKEHDDEEGEAGKKEDEEARKGKDEEGGADEVVAQEGSEGEGEGEEEEEEDEEESEEQSEEEEEDEGGFGGYSLRKRRPVIYQYQPVIQVVDDDTPPKKHHQIHRRKRRASFHTKARSAAPRAYQQTRKPRHSGSDSGRKKHVQHHGDSSTTSSGSDSDEASFRRRKARSMAKARSQCLPMNLSQEDIAKGPIRDRVRIGASLADVDPMNIDQSVTFDSIGGLKQHIRALKEMIIFPLLYPEVFERFKIDPPRGVLFYGPPGCGKTLVARALANECSKGGKKVAFFMRKGADCLSKWVGESERQLRLLFDQAYQMRPSIIFFDEIDGLAPVRSSRQDQIHSSIVSTLLALMDGLDSRGEIVIIGATNRIDAIDPALRRPGRFDREFLFPLPSREDRRSILTIHTRRWDPPLKPEFVSELAENTVGYCGADLKALCTESALYALRRKYPQIYKTSDKLVLDVESINVSASDFHQALKTIVPTAQRSDTSIACSLPEHMRPLLLKQFSLLLSQASFVFPPSWKAVSKATKDVRSLLAIEDEHTKQIHASLVLMKSAALLSNDPTTESPQFNSSLYSDFSSKTSNANLQRQELGIPKNRVGAPAVGRGVESPHHFQPSRQRHTSVEGWSGFQRSPAPGVRSSGRPMPPTNSEKRFDKLFHSSRPAELEDIYFDMSDTCTGKDQDTTTNSVLVGQGQPHSNKDLSQSHNNNETDSTRTLQVTHQSSSLSSHRYLTLSSHPHTIPPVHRPRLILCGFGGLGQSSHLAPALLHSLEELPVKTLDLTTLFGSSTKTPEEACTQVFREAKRVAPSIIYLPRINAWWDVTADTFRATLLSLIHSLPPATPMLLLATAECHYHMLPPILKSVFSESSEVFSLGFPTLDERRRFFHNLLLKKTIQPPPPKPKPLSEVKLDDLPLAPPPKPRELNQQELERIEKQREAVLRELRVFLRDATNKLLAERKFKEFGKPVNAEEVFDYYEIIKEPMDLGTIMKKIDEHRYTTPKQWIRDVDLITKNALEYNPEHDSESRLLRHRAVALQDMAHSFLDHELSEEFEKQCEEISQTYRRMGKEPPFTLSPMKSTSGYAGHSSAATSQSEEIMFIDSGCLKAELYNAPRRSLRQKGLDPDGSGLPYYSPPKPRAPRLHSGEDGSGDSGEERSEDMETQTEEDDVTVIESRNSVDEKESGDYSMSGVEETPKESANSSKVVLRNVSVRRQIIRPWEDKQDDVPSLTTTPTTTSEKKTSPRQVCESTPLSTLKTTPPESKTQAAVLLNSHSSRKHSNVSEGSYSIQTAAEALVEMGWSSPEKSNVPQVEIDRNTEVFDKAHSVNDSTVQIEEAPCSSETNVSPEIVRSEVNVSESATVIVDHERLLALFDRVTKSTEKCTVNELERLHSVFEHLVFRYRMMEDRNPMIQDLELATDLFLQSCFQNEHTVSC